MNHIYLLILLIILLFTLYKYPSKNKEYFYSNNDYQSLLNLLQNNIYCRIAPSKIVSGEIGVFAIKDIPKGIDPFITNINNPCHVKREDIIHISKKDIDTIDSNVKKLINDFYTKSSNYYPINKGGPNNLNFIQFINHSDNPNLTKYSLKNCGYVCYKTNRLIKQGEELTFHYSKKQW